MLTATPEASSSAPGASRFVSITSEARQRDAAAAWGRASPREAPPDPGPPAHAGLACAGVEDPGPPAHASGARVHSRLKKAACAGGEGRAARADRTMNLGTRAVKQGSISAHPPASSFFDLSCGFLRLGLKRTGLFVLDIRPHGRRGGVQRPNLR